MTHVVDSLLDGPGRRLAAVRVSQMDIIELQRIPDCHAEGGGGGGRRQDKRNGMGFWRGGIFQPIPVIRTGYTVREINIYS